MNLTESKLIANQGNAQLSTGPRTVEGKQRSSRNALKTGLTGVTVLLPTDNLEQYEAFSNCFRTEWTPVGDRETELVQALIDTQWRLNRIPQLQYAFEAEGRDHYFSRSVLPETDPAEDIRALLHAHQLFEKQINNLYYQEARLYRQLTKLTRDLTDLQQQRKSEEARKARAAQPQLATQPVIEQLNIAAGASLPSLPTPGITPERRSSIPPRFKRRR